MTRNPTRLPLYDDLYLASDFVFLDGVPATRADCPTQRPCPYLECRYHLWSVEGEGMPGRRRADSAPAAGFRPATNTTCALDVADRGGISMDEVAAVMGLEDARQVRRIQAEAVRKLKLLPSGRRLLQALGEMSK